jgi:sugar (pentulose or hexulose) kinase
MSIVIGLDIGTTTITAVAVEESGSVYASVSLPSPTATTSQLSISGRPYSNAELIPTATRRLLVQLGERLGADGKQVVGITVTGQQHGCLLVDAKRHPKTPLVNWQDKRGDDAFPGVAHSFVHEAIARCGTDLPSRTGCRLASGYMATTLFCWKEKKKLKEGRTASFISDLIASRLAKNGLTTDSTLAASGGVFNLVANDWDWEAIDALGLPHSLFPPILASGSLLGRFAGARAFNLPPNVPVYVGLGDHQASFLGAVADPANSLFINIGTGGQVAAYIKDFHYDPALETRPFPGGGFELVSAGLTGGKAYATLEGFFRKVGVELFDKEPAALFARLNALAEKVSPGCDGLRCEPYFAGTRRNPDWRASWSGMSDTNFTPGHMARAVLEGMARALREGAEQIEKNLPAAREIIVGAGNGIRENPLFTSILAREFGRPIRVPHHREEAAYGAAIVAAIGAGLLPDFASAGRWIRYDEPT